MGLTAVDLDIMAEPDRVVPLCCANSNGAPRSFQRAAAARLENCRANHKAPEPFHPVCGERRRHWPLGYRRCDRTAVADKPYCLMRAPLGWHVDALPIRHPLDYLGADGAAGIGGAPGMSVGSALALRGSGRLPIAVFGDGDYLMGVAALWTAASHNIPLLIIIANNQGYYIDEQHQVTTSLARGRPTETAPTGQKISGPEIDILAMASAQGFEGQGPVYQRSQLVDAIRRRHRCCRKRPMLSDRCSDSA